MREEEEREGREERRRERQRERGERARKREECIEMRKSLWRSSEWKTALISH